MEFSMLAFSQQFIVFNDIISAITVFVVKLIALWNIVSITPPYVVMQKSMWSACFHIISFTIFKVCVIIKLNIFCQSSKLIDMLKTFHHGIPPLCVYDNSIYLNLQGENRVL
jgi:hypothetical protein